MSLREHEPMLAALAGAAERKNRPTAVVAFAAALLVGATAYSLWNMKQARAARRAYEREGQVSLKVSALAEEVRSAVESAKTHSADTDPYAPKELLSALSSAATSAGVTKPPSFVPTTDESPDSPLVKKIVVARLLGEPMSAVLAWIEKALAETPGLHVTQFNLKPTRSGWDTEVRFARWEIKQPS